MMILAFQYAQSLRMLDLSDCSISNIDEKTYQQIPNIEIINLKNNRLEKYTQFKNLY